MNFFYGALLDDHRLFNAGLEARATRSIDIFENEEIDEAALKNLIRAAVALNNAKSKAAKPAKPVKMAAKSTPKTKSKK